jgi:16S rRNA (uracil1498-N3)-methyltransferase
MESIYVPIINSSSSDCVVIDDEFKHIRALRININERMIITNGMGLSVIAELRFIDKNSASFNIIEESSTTNENEYISFLAVGILDNKDRMEFAVEKAVELGINSVYPLQSRYTQKSKTNTARLMSKSISAMKQCKRSYLPEIFEPVNLKSLRKIAEGFSNVILLDESGTKPAFETKCHSVLMIVGPEGGFSEEEINEMSSWKNLTTWTLGARRLRAETAVTTGLALINHLLGTE